jgi:nicotinate-nucleotide--dimethylbenzimidazole phosphoribosyltransferase
MTAPDLAALAERVTRPDEAARSASRTALAERPAGGYGRLGDIASWLAGTGAVPGDRHLRARLVVLAGDHGIAAAGVSALPDGHTVVEVRGLVDGSAPTAAVARTAQVPVQVVDVCVDGAVVEGVSGHRVRSGSGRIDVEDACSADEAAAAFGVGTSLADAHADGGGGLLVLGDVGRGATTHAAALIGLLTRSDAAQVTGRGSGIDDRAWMTKAGAVRDAMRRGRPLLGDPLRLLAAVGGPLLAASTGLLVQAAARRTPVLLDGVVGLAAALLGQRIAFRATDWWQPASAVTEPAARLATDRLSLEPLLDLRLEVGGGLGALAAAPLLRAAAALLAEAGTGEAQPEA